MTLTSGILFFRDIAEMKNCFMLQTSSMLDIEALLIR